MKNISRWIVISVLFYGLVLAGCDKRSDVERDDLSFEAMNSEEILGESSDYQALRSLMGDMTYKQLLALLDDSLKKLNALEKQGSTNRQDYITLKNIITNLYQAMLDENATPQDDAEEEGVNSSDALKVLLKAAYDKHVGALLKQVIAKTGSDILTENVYPMIVYAMAADDDILKNATNGLTVGSLTEDDKPDFLNTINVVNKLIDETNSEYADYDGIRTSLKALINALKNDEDLDLKVSSLKTTVDDLLVKDDDESSDADADSDTLDSEVLTAAAKALGDLWDDDPQFRADIKTILEEAGALMKNEVPKEINDSWVTANWDKNDMTDLDRILHNLEDVLGSQSSTRRANLKAFVQSALAGMKPSSDGDTLEGLVRAIATIDIDNNGTPDIREDQNSNGIKDFAENTCYVDKGLIEALRFNMYAQDRASADEKTSSLRALIFMMDQGNVDYSTLSAVSADTNGGTASSTSTNIDVWTIIEVVHAMQWAAQYNQNGTCSWMASADCNGDGEIDDFEALHWMLYKKHYKLLGLISVNGMAGMITNGTAFPLMWGFRAGVPEPFPAFVDLDGIRAEGLTEGNYGDTSWKSVSVYAHPGERHQLFALFGALMQYFYEQKGTQGCLDMLNMLLGMNEISASQYKTLYKTFIGVPTTPDNPDATFRTDNLGDILKAIEGPNGYGTLYYALRTHAEDALDGKLLDAILDVLVLVVDKLDSTKVIEKVTDADGTHANEYIFPALMDELDIQATTDDDIADTVETLFGTDGKSGKVQDLYHFLTRNGGTNHTAIVKLAAPIGNLMIALSGKLDTIGTDVETVWPIVSALMDTEETDTDSASTMSELIDYLTTGDNDFNRNARILAYRALDIYDATYNPTGTTADEVRITGSDGVLVKLLGRADDGAINTLLNVFFGDGALYDFEPVMNFLKTITKVQGTDPTDPDYIDYPGYLWSLVYTDPDEDDSLLDKVLGNSPYSDAGYTNSQGYTYKEIDISLDFVRALLMPVDTDADGVTEDSVVLSMLKVVNLQDTDFNEVLGDIHTLLSKSDLEPGTDSFNNLLKTLEFCVNNINTN